jgi:hypothetical protein
MSPEEAQKELANYWQVGKKDMELLETREKKGLWIFGCREVKGFPIDTPIEYFVVPGVLFAVKDTYLLMEIKALEKEIKIAVKDKDCIEAFFLADFLFLIFEKKPKVFKLDLPSYMKLGHKGGLAVDKPDFFIDLRNLITGIRVTSNLCSTFKR